MKPFSLLRLSKPMTAAALAIALIGCNKQETAQTEQQSAELANQRAELEAEKQKVALEKEEATKLRDESERLRAEAELRQAITKLTEQVEKAPAEPIAKGNPDTSAENAVAPVANTDQEVDLPPLPDLAPLPPVTKDVSYQPFYDELADKGSWMDSTDYGYVWQPPVGNSDDWAPYTDGGWSYTDAGWAWDSNESFGHVCYHYGRWVRLRGIGWVWVPGRDWAPAWVSWRSSDDCIGWAPLPPRARWTSGVGIHSWVDGICHIAPSCYTFVTIQNICHRRCRDVIIPRHECEHRYLHTRNVTMITEYKYDLHRKAIRCEGPAIDLVRKHLGSGLRENKIAFTDFKHGGAISANETKLPGVLTMPQWQLAKGIAQNDKPKLIQKKLAPTLEVINEPAKENRLAVRKLMAQEAQESLKQLPTRPKPSTATIATGPKQELNQPIRPGTSLPPVNAIPDGPRKQKENRDIAGTPTKPGKLKTEEQHQPEKPFVAGNARPLPPVQTRLNPLPKNEKPSNQEGNPSGPSYPPVGEPRHEQKFPDDKTAHGIVGGPARTPSENGSTDRKTNPGMRVIPEAGTGLPTRPGVKDQPQVAENPTMETIRKQQADRNKAIQEKLQQDADEQSRRLHGQQGPTKLPPIVQNPPTNQQQGPTKLPPVIMPSPNQNPTSQNNGPDTAAIRQKQAEEQSRKQEQEWAQRRAQAEQAQMSQKAEQAREAQRQLAERNQQQQAAAMRQRQENQENQQNQVRDNDRQSALEAQRRQQEAAEKQSANRMRDQQIAQQQEAAAKQRQAEQARNQQAEDNRRQQQVLQARQQQEENNRRQQQAENARQQQAEMARRQEDNSRREAQQAQREAAQRQQENAQRRSAEEARERQQQQQQQQQENSRRQAEEANRRSQAEAAERRQQEESSRRQQDESRNKKGR